ncbi:hydrogenase 2 protein HybA, partial [Klebsiella pneumoniae]|nr:hydrogenase 2 protein HybA [Klebsiella pneumoniae]
NLGMPEVAPLSTGARSEHIQHTLYKGMVLPIAALAGITYLVNRNSKKQEQEHHKEDNDVES